MDTKIKKAVKMDLNGKFGWEPVPEMKYT